MGSNLIHNFSTQGQLFFLNDTLGFLRVTKLNQEETELQRRLSYHNVEHNHIAKTSTNT